MQDIQAILIQAIYNLWQIQTKVKVTPAPENATFADGRPVDYACNTAMRLAGQLKKSSHSYNSTTTSAQSATSSRSTSDLTPRTLAGQLRTEFLELIKNTPLAGTEVEIAGPGFLNFISPDAYFSAKLAELSANLSINISPDEYSASHSSNHTKSSTDTTSLPTTYRDQTVICEFSDPNPFKVLHVGHLYTSIVGDSISRLIEMSGGKVIRANFGGDVGLHVAKNLYAMLKRREVATSSHSASPSINPHSTDPTAILDPTNSTPLSQKAEFMATCYVEGTRAYEDDPTAHAEITELNHLIYHLVQFAISQGYLHGADPLTPEQISDLTAKFIPTYQQSFTPETLTTISQLYWHGRATSYAYFKEFYAKIGLTFDKFYPESTVAGLGLQTVKAHTATTATNPHTTTTISGSHATTTAFTPDNPTTAKQHPATYIESDGAIIFPGENYGLHTRVFINQNGLPTYETKDVGLLFTKWQDYHFDKSIVITGNEQFDYMKVVLKSVEQYAPDLVHRTTHLTHGMVKLPGHVKMSSRKGNFLKAIDVLNLVTTTLQENYHSDDPIISLGATKYALLKYKIGGNIDFNIKESVSMTGNSGPYLQYSAVRAKKILAKATSNSTKITTSNPTNSTSPNSTKAAPNSTQSTPHSTKATSLNPTSLNPSEKSLIKKLLAYPSTLSDAVQDLAPHKICTYLYDLAQSFSRFYEHTPVIGSAEESSRLHLVQTYLSILTHGLYLLGINVPEEM